MVQPPQACSQADRVEAIDRLQLEDHLLFKMNS
jgi:hypothetical protein